MHNKHVENPLIIRHWIELTELRLLFSITQVYDGYSKVLFACIICIVYDEYSKLHFAYVIFRYAQICLLGHTGPS